ncbi:MAG TPA: tol-pal system protein YbgF, partial [Polyangiales bacterium]|nr:tol-pal system protein YbgF [Polyangiales bacterium]
MPVHEMDKAPALETRALVARQADQARQIAELEARIALLESEAREAREGASTNASTSPHATDTIRIGPNAETTTQPVAAPALTEIASADREPTTNHRIPSYRLYGHASAKSADALAPVPVVDETLPVAPLPETRAKRLPPSAAEAGAPDATDDYRAALRMLNERRFDEALGAFSAFVSDHPDDPLLPKALYWRGETRYAKRDYAQALSDFEALLARFPDNDKAPDALLKAALCSRHLGAEDKAQGYFRRLLATYPNSQAASVASRE